MEKSVHETCRDWVRQLTSADDEATIQNMKIECDKFKAALGDHAADMGLIRTSVSDDIEQLKTNLEQLRARNITFVRRTDVDNRL